MILFEERFEEECAAWESEYWEEKEAAWEAEWDEWAAREAAAQAFYDSLSSEKLEALLKEGDRICASSLK